MANRQTCDKQHADEESCSAIPPILQWNSEVLPTNFAFTYHNDEAKTALNGMKMNDSLCDVRLVVDEMEIGAHKTVLAAAIPYFHGMFAGSSFIEAHQEKIAITDIDYQAFQLLIEYAYTARIEITEDNVRSCLAAASYLQITDVIKWCCGFLGSSLNPSNCWSIRDIFDMHGCVESAKEVDSLIRVHFPEIIQHDSFVHLEKDRMIDVLKCDDLIVESEEQVYKFALEWMRHDLSDRQQYVDEIMAHVRFSVMRKNFLMAHVETEPLLKNHAQCMDYISEAIQYQVSKGQSNTDLVSSPARPRLVRRTDLMFVDKYGFIEFCDLRNGRCRPGCRNTMNIDEVVSLNGKFYALGTVFSQEERELVPRVDVYDPINDAWSPSRPMNGHYQGVRAAVHNERIFIFHRYRGETYDPKTDRWTNIARMLNLRYHFGVGVINDEIYATGGVSDYVYKDFPTKSVERYNFKENYWTPVPNMNIGRSHHGAAVLDDVLYVVGGQRYDHG